MLYEVRRGSTARTTEPIETASKGIYPLVFCPPLACGNFVLVRKDEAGRSHLLAMGRVSHDSPTLNLAHVRRLGAELGANEIHVYPAAEAVEHAASA